MRYTHKRSISNVLAALILIVIVAFAGLMLFFMTAGYFHGGGKASITLSATGTGSSDGTKASINLVIQNTGDGAAKVTRIFIAPESAEADPNSLNVLGFDLATSGKLSDLTQLTSDITIDENGEVIDAKATRTVYMHVIGSGLYAGAQLRIYVVYFDVGSGEYSVADTVVVLR